MDFQTLEALVEDYLKAQAPLAQAQLSQQIAQLQQVLSEIPAERSVFPLVKRLYSKTCHSNLLHEIEVSPHRAALLDAAQQLYAAAMQRYAAELAQPLADVWENYDELVELERSLRQLDPAECPLEVGELRQRAALLAHAIDHLLPFCLEDSNASHPIRYLPSALRGAKSIHCRVGKLLTSAEALYLAVPNARFNAVLPPSPALDAAQLVRAAPPECLLCGDAARVQVHFCSDAVCGQKLLCQACARSHAWSAQHDEDRAFSQLRPAPCPFCRRPTPLEELAARTVIFTSKQAQAPRVTRVTRVTPMRDASPRRSSRTKRPC